jgi:hypothetical protein
MKIKTLTIPVQIKKNFPNNRQKNACAKNTHFYPSYPKTESPQGLFPLPPPQKKKTALQIQLKISIPEEGMNKNGTH